MHQMRNILFSLFVIFSCSLPTHVFALPIDRYVAIQPIQVCDDAGVVCANTSRQLWLSEMNKIWSQAGVQVKFLPWRVFKNTTYLAIDSGYTTSASLGTLKDLPGARQSEFPEVLNMWFVKSVDNNSGVLGYSLSSAPLEGMPYIIAQNALSITDYAFSRSAVDTIAHEIGHSFGLDHSTFGATGSTNLMSSNTYPTSASNIYPDGSQYDQLNSSQITMIRTYSIPYIKTTNISYPSVADEPTSSPAPDTTAPTTPTGLSATAVSTSQINVSWSASTDATGVTGYRIYRGGSLVTTSSGTSYSDTGLTADTSYSYTVSAYDAAGNVSSQSSPSSATTNALPIIDVTGPVLSTISASGVAVDGFTISWTTDEAATTQVEYGPSAFYGYQTTKISTLVTSHSQSISSLSADSIYHYRVISIDEAGNTSRSSDGVISTLPAPVASPAPDTTAPTTPTGLSATAVSTSQINVSWSASTDATGVTGYRIYRGGSLVASVTGTFYSNSGLNSATTYSYTIASYDAAGNTSTQSSPVGATTLSPTPSASSDSAVPPIPANGSPSSLPAYTKETSISLTTNKSAMCRYASAPLQSFSAMKAFATTGGTSHSTFVTGLTNGAIHTFYIKCDSSGATTAGDYIISFSVANPPNPTVTPVVPALPAVNLPPNTTPIPAKVTPRLIVTPVPQKPVKPEVYPDAIAEDKTMELRGLELPRIKKDLKIGDSGPEVIVLQKSLNALGFTTSKPGKESDYYSQATSDAVREFKKAYYRVSNPSDEFDETTRMALNSLIDARTPLPTAQKSTFTWIIHGIQNYLGDFVGRLKTGIQILRE